MIRPNTCNARGIFPEEIIDFDEHFSTFADSLARSRTPGRCRCASIIRGGKYNSRLFSRKTRSISARINYRRRDNGNGVLLTESKKNDKQPV